MLATIGDYNERVRQGKRIEALIIKNLKALLQPRNVQILPPTSHEDIKDKIDGWLVSPSGKRHSLQIKYRESGDDIIFEVIKDIRKWLPGRDVDSVAELYLFVDRSGTARLYWTAPIKVQAQMLAEDAGKEMASNPQKSEWSGPGYEMKRRRDLASGTEKLVAFFKPLRFSVIEKWENLI